jgi:hypothetical protein
MTMKLKTNRFSIADKNKEKDNSIQAIALNK